ncbi:organic cation transporter protein-like [Diprion similis]|uniref:organic cation transporter protein-like n=1 Tax=Diprion similis TaxID=362088 RepID=UPI001EF79FBA|nr:organic cation transporter protein-like [Diprion similis]
MGKPEAKGATLWIDHLSLQGRLGIPATVAASRPAGPTPITDALGDRDVVVPSEELIVAAAGFGIWQIMIIAILGVMIMTHMLNGSLEPVQNFAGWWCEKPPILRSWTNQEWIAFSHADAPKPEVEGAGIAGTRRAISLTPELWNGRFRGCNIFRYNFAALRNIPFERSPMMNRRYEAGTVKCKRFQYSRKFGQTIAEKYRMACNPEYERAMWEGLMIFGKITGYLTFGCLSDRTGRRPVLLIASGVTPLTAIGLVFSPNYITYVAVRTCHSFFHGGFIVNFVMVAELSSNVARNRIMAFACLAYGLGVGMTPTLLSAMGSMDHLLLAINLPAVAFFLALVFFVPESPCWLFCTRRSVQLAKVIQKAGKTNGTPIPADFHVVYVEYNDVEKQLPRKPPSFWSLLKASGVTCEMIGIGFLVCLSGVINGGAQAKLIYNQKRVQTWYAIIGDVEMAGIIASQFCLLMMGHKRLLHLTIFLFLLTTFALMSNLRDDYFTTTGPATTLLAANVFAVGLSYGTLLNYGARTVPTLLRGTYTGIWNALWVAITWAGTRHYYDYPGFSSVAGLSILLAALFTFNMHHLLWREMPDTIFDAVNFKELVTLSFVP